MKNLLLFLFPIFCMAQTLQKEDPMFIAVLTYVKPLSEVDRAVPEHLEYLKALFDEKKLLVCGGQKPRTGGVIIAGNISKSEFIEILDEDPFTKAGVSRYQLIEFIPRFYDPCLEEIVAKPSVFVYVKHYLTPEGISYFKKKWFPKVQSIISKQPGFVSIEYDADSDSPDCMFITLKFKDDATFNDWCAIPEHDDLVNALDAFRSRDYWEAVRTDDENAKPSRLKWEIIKPSQ